MATTPFISEIKNQGGSFYTFTSSKEDFNFTLSNPHKKFRFSKIVALDIPDIKDQSSGINALGLDAQPGSFLRYDEADWNRTFAESFQNYCLNLETSIISKDTYDESKPLTVAERVFWKWLKEVGAIRYREARVGNPEDGGERLRRTTDNALVNNPTTREEIGKRFVEEDDNTDTSGGKLPYNRIVKYIGNIDIVNAIKHKDNSYTELYIYVPTQSGSTPTILFKSITDDSNYTYDMSFENKATNPLNREYLNGREYTDTHPSRMDIRATFDSDVNAFSAGTVGINNYSLEIKKLNTGSYEEGWWFPNPNANSYFTEPTKLNDYRNDKLKISGYRDSVSVEKEFIRSRLDGVVVDFDLAKSYSDNVSGQYKSFDDYNKSENSKNFQYNAIMIYYDLIDTVDPTLNATNLYGVLFLNNVTDTLSGGGEIKRNVKYKPSKLLSQNGNAFGYKLNIFLDLNGENSTIETIVNEYNTFSMEMFIDALQNMAKNNDSLLGVINALGSLEAKINSLEDTFYNTESIAQLRADIDAIYTSLDTAQDLYASTDSIIGLINRNYNEILNIYKNNTSVEMSYNLDVIQNGKGVEIDRSIANRIKLNSTLYGYTFNDKPIVYFTDFSTSNDSTFYYYKHNLKFGENYLKVYTDTNRLTDTVFSNGQSAVIYIDDTDQRWENGMKMRVSFGNGFQFLGTTPGKLIIKTDAKNTLQGTLGYSKVIVELDATTLKSWNWKPVLDLICINAETFEFEVDFLNN